MIYLLEKHSLLTFVSADSVKTRLLDDKERRSRFRWNSVQLRNSS